MRSSSSKSFTKPSLSLVCKSTRKRDRLTEGGKARWETANWRSSGEMEERQRDRREETGAAVAEKSGISRRLGDKTMESAVGRQRREEEEWYRRRREGRMEEEGGLSIKERVE
ncbi:hypothetical protein AAHE18_16G241000 [Arachis hypogaea]